MLVASDIITEARNKLKDIDKDRWSDDRLLNLLFLGLNDIAINSKLYTRTFYMKVVDNENIYDISDKVHRIERVQYQADTALPLKTYNDMDNYKTKWELDIGDEIKAIIYDKQDSGRFKVYPIPQNTKNSNIVVNQDFGVITDIYTSEIQPVLEETFGDLGPVEDLGYLVIFAVKRHPKVLDLTEEVDITSTTLPIITSYIAGQALSDDTDSINIEKSKAHMLEYNTLLGEVKRSKATNFTDSNIKTAYNTGI